MAEGDLRERLGTLRYLLTLRTREAAREAAAAAAAAAAAGSAGQQHEQGGGGGLDAAAQQQQREQQQQEQQQQEQQQDRGDEGRLGSSSDRAAGPSAAAAGPASPARAPAAAAAGEEVEEDLCPVCQEALGPSELVMLPCGHRLHTSCHMAVLDRLPAGHPAASRRVGCPTCRSRVLLSEVVFVESRAAQPVGQVRWAGLGLSTVPCFPAYLPARLPDPKPLAGWLAGWHPHAACRLLRLVRASPAHVGTQRGSPWRPLACGSGGKRRRGSSLLPAPLHPPLYPPLKSARARPERPGAPSGT